MAAELIHTQLWAGSRFVIFGFVRVSVFVLVNIIFVAVVIRFVRVPVFVLFNIRFVAVLGF